MLVENIRWIPRNGLSVRFWSDSWLPHHGELKTLSIRNLQEEELNAKLFDYVLPNGEWNMSVKEGKMSFDTCIQTQIKSVKGLQSSRSKSERNETKWSRPKSPGYKLNCDGAVDASQNAVCGGIMLDSQGKFVFAYAYKLSEISVVEAEIMAILFGVQIAWERGYQVLEESNSKLAVELLLNGCDSRHACAQIVNNINSFVHRRCL